MSDLLLTPDDAARVLRRVRAECIDEGACLIWQGCVKQGNGQPQANIGPWRGVSLPRLVFYAQHGRAPRRGLFVVPDCGNRRCLACLREVTRREFQRRASARGAYSHPVAIANRTAAQRKRLRYSDELIAQVRELPCSNAEAARQTGVSNSYVRALRAGRGRVPALGVWAGLMP